MTKPIITVAEDFDTGLFTLMATSYGRTEVAGPRLFRAPPHPAICFEHVTEADAIRDAQLLRDYLDAAWPKKAMSKAVLRRGGE